MVSAAGSGAGRYNACIALSLIVGMPSGLFLPFFFGISIRLSGEALQPLRLSDKAPFIFLAGVFHISPSVPGVFAPLPVLTRNAANNFA